MRLRRPLSALSRNQKLHRHHGGFQSGVCRPARIDPEDKNSGATLTRDPCNGTMHGGRVYLGDLRFYAASTVYPPRLPVALFIGSSSWRDSLERALACRFPRSIPRRNRQFAIRRGSVEAERTRLVEALISPSPQCNLTYRIKATAIDLLSRWNHENVHRGVADLPTSPPAICSWPERLGK